LGGPNTIDERMTPVYSVLISRIGFSFFLLLLDWKRKRDIYRLHLYRPKFSNRMSLPGHQL
jgi:hypothetical protein